MKAVKSIKPKGSKSIAFPSTSRAIHAYEQAVQVLNTCYFAPGVDLVKRTGNVVTVPDWFPFSSN